MGRGNTTTYKEDYARQAYVACKEGGFSDAKLAKLFGVSPKTIYNWKNEFPEFLQSIKDGKDDYDTMNVENDLLRRARGFKFTEKELRPDDSGNMQVVRETKKLVIPDTTAQIFWLKNRNHARWRDKVDTETTLHLGDKTKEFLERVTDQAAEKIWQK